MAHVKLGFYLATLAVITSITMLCLLACSNSSSPQAASYSVPTVTMAARPVQFKSSVNVQSMQLISKANGWAVTEKGLLYTEDTAKTWRDITPPSTAAGAFRETFFLDASNGWVVTISEPDEAGAAYLDVHITADAGKTWETHRLTNSDPQYAQIGSTGVSLSFADVMHGWAMVRLPSGVQFSNGQLLRTDDGGKTWRTLATPPLGDPIQFTSLTNGWLAGGPAGNKLFVTNDGGNSWQPQTITAPTAYADYEVAYSLPVFKDQANGILPVTFSKGELSAVSFYKTQNGGKVWSLAGSYPIRAELGVVVALPVAIVSDKLWFVKSPNAGELFTFSENQRQWKTTPFSDTSTFLSLQFATESIGWALSNSSSCKGFKSGCTTQSKLLATEDGGKTWLNVTP